MRDKTHENLLGSVLWLANEDSPDPERRSRPFTPQQREDMLGAIADGLPLLYAATRPGAVPRRPRPPGTRARTKPKPKPRRRR